MAIDPLSSGVPGLPLTEPRALTVVQPGSSRTLTSAKGDRPSALQPAGASSSTTIISEIFTPNPDGSVTIEITYRDGHRTTTTSSGSAMGAAAYRHTGELQAAQANLGQLVDITV